MTESIRFGCLVVYRERVFNWLEQQQVFEAFARESQTTASDKERASAVSDRKLRSPGKWEDVENGFGVWPVGRVNIMRCGLVPLDKECIEREGG